MTIREVAKNRARSSGHPEKSSTLSVVLALSFQFGLSVLLTGCGYTFQNSKSDLVEKEGIHKIYIAPLANESFKPGIENVVYNWLQRTLAQGGRVKIVSSESAADAVVQGAVEDARYTVSVAVPARNQKTASDVTLGATDSLGDILVASEYTAFLNCRFKLMRRNPAPGQTDLVWSGAFSRNKPFPGSNTVGISGSTAALINDSEFDRALSDLAKSMMSDIHESMLAMF